MNEIDPYNLIHNKLAPNVRQMSVKEILIHYLTRRNSGANQKNTGPSNLMNIIIRDRLEELGLDPTKLESMGEEEIRKLAYKKSIQK